MVRQAIKGVPTSKTSKGADIPDEDLTPSQRYYRKSVSVSQQSGDIILNYIMLQESQDTLGEGQHPYEKV
jgi:hypothetical protein